MPSEDPSTYNSTSAEPQNLASMAPATDTKHKNDNDNLIGIIEELKEKEPVV